MNAFLNLSSRFEEKYNGKKHIFSGVIRELNNYERTIDTITIDNYKASFAISCTFCGITIPFAADFGVDLGDIKSVNDLKGVIIEFVKSSISLDLFLNGEWWVIDLLERVKYR